MLSTPYFSRFKSTRYLATAQRFYGWLVGPFEAQLASRGIHELVFVPDGYLRLVPFAALHDGRGFVAERYAVSTITGLTMTETGNERESQTLSLLAGLSSPGPVVNTLISMGFMDSTPAGRAAARRAVAQAQPDASGHTPSAADSAHAGAESALRSELALPGSRFTESGTFGDRQLQAAHERRFHVGRFQSRSHRPPPAPPLPRMAPPPSRMGSFAAGVPTTSPLDVLQRMIAATAPWKCHRTADAVRLRAAEA